MKTSTVVSLVLLATASFAGELKPGSSVFGKHEFIEYIPGDLPLVLAAPHGGLLAPEEIPDRKNGVVGTDVNTQELARTIADVIHAETGRHIHLIICRLHRRKLDANREIVEAAQGNKIAEQAWSKHHDFIDEACEAAVRKFGVAFLIDLHGHAHPVPHVELGYLQDAPALAKADAALNEKASVNSSSLRWIVEHSRLSHAELLRGPMSFGALLEQNDFLATPSPRLPVPPEPFFRGGYTVNRHCQSNRNVTGLQIETNRPRLRDTPENRLKFARALLSTLQTYFTAHLGFGIDGQKPEKPRVPITRLQPASPAQSSSQ